MSVGFKHSWAALGLAVAFGSLAVLDASAAGPHLSGLEVRATAGGISALSPAFSQSVFSYTIDVQSDIAEAVVVPAVRDGSTLKVSVNGEPFSPETPPHVPLVVGDNAVRIVARDGAGRASAYVVTIRREDMRPVVDRFRKLSFHDPSTGVTMGYRLYVPEGYDASRRYPLVLFLHGAGESGSDNEVQLTANQGATVWAKPQEQARHPCFVLAPQNPKDPRATSPGDLGRMGWTSLMRYGFYNPFKSEPVLKAVFALLQRVEADYSIDPDRVYSTGLSMGCFGVFALNVDHPDTFAAIVGIAGGLDPARAVVLAKKPIWVFHGSQDLVVDVRFSRDTVKALRGAGGSPRYTEYGTDVYIPTNGHPSWVPAYASREMKDWLFEQTK